MILKKKQDFKNVFFDDNYYELLHFSGLGTHNFGGTELFFKYILEKDC